jgi:hypothetical protein
MNDKTSASTDRLLDLDELMKQLYMLAERWDAQAERWIEEVTQLDQMREMTDIMKRFLNGEDLSGIPSEYLGFSMNDLRELMKQRVTGEELKGMDEIAKQVITHKSTRLDQAFGLQMAAGQLRQFLKSVGK